MPNRPLFLTAATNTSSAEYKKDSLAWELFNTKTKPEIEVFLKGCRKIDIQDFWMRYRKCLAWWWLSYLNLGQIHAELQALPKDEEKLMRDLLNQQRAEYKQHKRNSK